MDRFRAVILWHILFTANKILKQGKLKITDICSCHALLILNGLRCLSFTIKMSEFMATQNRRIHDSINNWIRRECLTFDLIVTVC